MASKKDKNEIKSTTVLNADLRAGVFAPVYVLYGDEDYLKYEYGAQLVKAIRKQNSANAGFGMMTGDAGPGELSDLESDINVTSMTGDTATAEAVMDAAQTLPFFADKRLIILDDTGWFKAGNHEGELLAEFMKNWPDSCHIVITEKTIDKRSKLYKAANSAGKVLELAQMGEEELVMWMAKRLKSEGRGIGRRTAEMIVDYCGRDMNTLGHELEKLVAYTEGREGITDADVEAVCSKSLQIRVFDMIDRIISGDKRFALILYYDLIAAKEPPMRLIVMMGRQFARLAEVAVCMDRGMRKDEIAAEVGVQLWLASKLMDQARSVGYKRLKRGLELCVRAQESIVVDSMDEQLALEMLISEA